MDTKVAVRPPGSISDQIAYGLDSLIISQVKKLAPADDAGSLTERLRDMRAIQDELVSNGALADDALMFPEPGKVNVTRRLLPLHKVGFYEWRWQSHHPMIFPEIEAKYRSRHRNGRARLRMLKLKPKDSTMAIVINGFSSGHHLIERIAWPIRLFRRQGIGVALYALPFHGPRSHVFPPEWPGEDLRMLIEGFRQAIWDLRVAIRALREQGAKRVGVIGMSLGGYTSALLATVTSDVDFVIPYVPIASIPDFMEENALVPTSPELQQQLANANRTHMDAISPLSRAPAVAPERITVISGELDQLATVEHGATLSEHLGCRHVVFRGAHVVQKGRAGAFKDTFRELRRSGVLPVR
jgi:dienelactone hydrolase